MSALLLVALAYASEARTNGFLTPWEDVYVDDPETAQLLGAVLEKRENDNQVYCTVLRLYYTHTLVQVQHLLATLLRRSAYRDALLARGTRSVDFARDARTSLRKPLRFGK